MMQWLDRVAALRDCSAVRGLAAVAGSAGGTPIGRPSLAPVASARWTISRCWNASRRAPGAGLLRTAARWSSCTRTRSSSSAADQQLKDQLLAELHRVYPELSRRGVVAEEWLVRNDCPLHGTGPWEQRLTVETPHPRIVLAGDGIRCDFPVALMERAATTGFLAANQLLAARAGRPRSLDCADALPASRRRQRSSRALTDEMRVSRGTRRAAAARSGVRRTRGRPPRASGQYAGCRAAAVATASARPGSRADPSRRSWPR